MKRVFGDFEPEHKFRKLFHIGNNMKENLYFINSNREEYTVATISGSDTFSEYLLNVYLKAGWEPHREKIYFTTNPDDYNIERFKDVTTRKKEKGYLMYVSTGIILSVAVMYQLLQ